MLLFERNFQRIRWKKIIVIVIHKECIVKGNKIS